MFALSYCGDEQAGRLRRLWHYWGLGRDLYKWTLASLLQDIAWSGSFEVGRYIRKVIGCAASPTRVTSPPWLSHGFVGQYESLLCQTLVPAGVVANISLNGYPKSLPFSHQDSKILLPDRLVGSSDRQVCINIHVHSSGFLDEHSWTRIDQPWIFIVRIYLNGAFRDLLLVQVNTPLGWKVIKYLWCNARNAKAASRLRVVMVTLATTGDLMRAASTGPSRNSRVGEWAPSAPMRRLPVSFVPSSKIAVTKFSPVSTVLRRFPYYLSWVQSPVRRWCGSWPWHRRLSKASSAISSCGHGDSTAQGDFSAARPSDRCELAWCCRHWAYSSGQSGPSLSEPSDHLKGIRLDATEPSRCRYSSLLVVLQELYPAQTRCMQCPPMRIN